MDTAEPATADRGRFRFRAGRPSLDLCSTLLWRHVGPVEQLTGPGRFAAWLDEAGLLPTDTGADVTVDRSQLASATRLRESIYGLARDGIAGRVLHAPALSVLNEAVARSGRVPVLTRNGSCRLHADRPVEAALSEIARDFVVVVTTAGPGRLRECAAEHCAFLFLDTSRAGARRWCAANRCGNRAHVRAHRLRAAATSKGDDNR